MQKKRDESDLIWESFISGTQHKQNTELKRLWEQDVKYVEQFLIDEGLMDKVKGAYQGAKEFASSKLLKPVMTFLAKIIANDPQTSEKAAAAAKKGPEALQQLASAEGDQGVVQQLEQIPAPQQAESFELNLNDMIVEALVSDGLITESAGEIIIENRKYDYAKDILSELSHKGEIPYMPVTERMAPVKSGYVGNTRRDVAELKRQVKSFLTANPKMATSGRFKQLTSVIKSMDREGRGAEGGTAQTPQQPAATATPEQPAATATPEQPAGAVAPDQQSTQPAGPSPSSIQSQGLLGKIWNFIKSNKGAISGAAALGIAAALTATGNPMASSYLTGALIGGVRGAIKGATGTEGGFVDKLKGAANQAGKESMIGGGIGAAAAGVGGMISDLGVGGDVAANADAASPAAEPTVGGDEFSEPTRPDADELAQMQADTGMQDPEANANAGLPDPYDPANSEAPSDPEANANAGLPDPYDPANSEAPMQEPTRPDDGTTRGINPDGSEYTKDADGNAVDGQQATDKKGFGQKFKDFFKPSETPRKLPTRVPQGRAF